MWWGVVFVIFGFVLGFFGLVFSEVNLSLLFYKIFGWFTGVHGLSRLNLGFNARFRRVYLLYNLVLLYL